MKDIKIIRLERAFPHSKQVYVAGTDCSISFGSVPGHYTVIFDGRTLLFPITSVAYAEVA